MGAYCCNNEEIKNEPEVKLDAQEEKEVPKIHHDRSIVSMSTNASRTPSPVAANHKRNSTSMFDASIYKDQR